MESLEGDPDFGCLNCIPKMKAEATKGKAKASTSEEGRAREEATQGDSETK